MMRALERLLSSHADPTIAAQQTAYMRNQFAFFGLPKPLRAKLTSPLLKQLTINSEKELISLLDGLWQQEEREFQYTALEIALRGKKLWTPAILGQFKNMIITRSWWDTVDTIASRLVGSLIILYPELITTMDTWIEDENLWVRRTALIFQLNYKSATDSTRLLNYCLKRSGEQDFFIKKAIGWALRQYSKTNPAAVQNFLSKHHQQLCSLSLKEAQKYL